MIETIHVVASGDGSKDGGREGDGGGGGDGSEGDGRGRRKTGGKATRARETGGKATGAKGRKAPGAQDSQVTGGIRHKSYSEVVIEG